MTDVERLLEQATPLPWRKSEDDPDDVVIWGTKRQQWVANVDTGHLLAGWTADGAALPESRIADMGEANAALIVHAVNHLPECEAAVDALERMIESTDRLLDFAPPVSSREFRERKHNSEACLRSSRAALRRLRPERDA